MRADKALRRTATPLQLAICTAPWERARGLLGRTAPAPGSALWIAPCCAIHTWGMQYPIDAVFLDARGLVLQVAPDCPPWTVVAARQATSVLELRAGECARLGLRPGERLTLPSDPPGGTRAAGPEPPARALPVLVLTLLLATVWLLTGCAASRPAVAGPAAPAETSGPRASPLDEVRLQAGLEYDSRAWVAAEAAYRELATREPRQGEHWYRLGVTYLHTRRPDAAARAFEAAVMLGARPGSAEQGLAIARVAQASAALRAAASAGAQNAALPTLVAALEELLPPGIAQSPPAQSPPRSGTAR